MSQLLRGEIENETQSNPNGQTQRNPTQLNSTQQHKRSLGGLGGVLGWTGVVSRLFFQMHLQEEKGKACNLILLKKFLYLLKIYMI